LIKDAKIETLVPRLDLIAHMSLLRQISLPCEQGRLRERFMTMYRREHSKAEWIGFLHTFEYSNKEGQTVLRLSSPLCFELFPAGEVYPALLEEVEKSVDEKVLMEYHGVTTVCRQAFFPISAELYDTSYNPSFAKFLRNEGWTCVEETSCYEFVESPSCGTTPHVIDDLKMRRDRYIGICQTSPEFPEMLLMEKICSWPEWPLNVSERLYFAPEHILFFEGGCARWLPQNLFGGQRSEGKIFQLLFCEEPKLDVFIDRLSGCIRFLFRKEIKNLQVSGIPLKISEKIEEMGGKKVYTMSRFQKTAESGRLKE
jgi:hypothetical protein